METRLHSDRSDSFRVIELEAKDTFNENHISDPVESRDHATMAGNKQTRNYQRFKPQPLNTGADPHQWRRSFSGVMRRDEPLSPWKRQQNPDYVMFQTRSPRLSFNARNRNSNSIPDTAQAAQGGDASAAPLAPQLEANVPAGRYLDALQGPELEVLKESEDVLLPLDQTWPFLLRFPINTFGIVLGLGSQTILWKKLATMVSMQFLHIPLLVNLCLWCLALGAYTVISLTYICKIIFYFEAVKREWYHPFRINFFFSPWVCGMFLALGIPPRIATSVHPAAWLVFMTPLLILELKIYGQWMSGGERRLSKVANPATHVSLVGNFVGSLLGATVNWKELATFFWSVGIMHYLIVFVTLYQRLPTNELLTKDMHPVYFLFLAIPSTASVALEKITGEFGLASRIVYFLSVFLLLSLLVRINIFRGFQFSLTWWAYTFPLNAVSIASIHYAAAVPSYFTRAVAAVFSFVAVAVVFVLFVFTLVHGRALFPNDMAIAITRKKTRKAKAVKLAKKDSSGTGSGITSNGSGSLDSSENTTDATGKSSRSRTVTVSVGCK